MYHTISLTHDFQTRGCLRPSLGGAPFASRASRHSRARSSLASRITRILDLTPNLPTKIIPTKICRLNNSGKSPLDMRIPPLEIKIMLESNPLRFRILVRRLATAQRGAACAVGFGLGMPIRRVGAQAPDRGGVFVDLLCCFVAQPLSTESFHCFVVHCLLTRRSLGPGSGGRVRICRDGRRFGDYIIPYHIILYYIIVYYIKL